MEDHHKWNILLKAGLVGMHLNTGTSRNPRPAFIRLALSNPRYSQLTEPGRNPHWSDHPHFSGFSIFASSFRLAWAEEQPVFISRHFKNLIVIWLFRPGERLPDGRRAPDK